MIQAHPPSITATAAKISLALHKRLCELAVLATRLPVWLYVVLILIAAAFLRFAGLRHGLSFHPDERHIMMVATRMRIDDLNPHFFAYGSLPFYLLWFIGQALALFDPFFSGYDGYFIVGRTLSALAGVATVYLTYRLARALDSSRWTALLAMLLLMLNVFHIQLSHFYAVDVVLTLTTTLALLAILRVQRKPSLSAHIAAGLTIGLALATKISALVLILPYAIAVVGSAEPHRTHMRIRSFLYSTVGVACCLLTFFLVAPYSILDLRQFLSDNRSQIDMVRGLWRPPYTVQYVGTAPFLYPLQQMFYYTIGWPVAALAFAALVLECLRMIRRPAARRLIVLLWTVIVFISIARLQVKFPRYLLPLYPLLMVYAARFLTELRACCNSHVTRRALHNILVIFVVGFSAVYALAFARLYSVQHAYYTASQWIYEQIPAGSSILLPHWDDGLPLHLPGLNPDRYQSMSRSDELPFYEPDSDVKLRSLAERLAAADYVIFPTQRIQGSLPRATDEFVRTLSLLTMLFNGQLGYENVYSLKPTPALGAWVFNDDRADESFTVYDHPKILIFRNTARLSAEEILSLVHGFSRDRIWSLQQFLEFGEIQPLTGSAAAAGRSSLPAFMIWLLALEALALAVFPLLALALPMAPDRGYGASKALGVLLLGFIIWFGSSLRITLATQPTALACTLALLLIGHRIVRAHWGNWRTLFRSAGRSILVAETIFLATFVFFTICAAFHPEIQWGEKPMDFTFLNYFIRLEQFPPQDPWASGQPMNYYYCGTVLMAVLHKLTGVDSALGYTLSIASLPALLAAASFSAAYWMSGRVWAGVCAAIAVPVASNLHIIRLSIAAFFGAINLRSFDLYWAASRQMTPPTFAEYPLWSFLFADLHAHVIVLPFTVLFLVLALRMIDIHERRRGLSFAVHRALLGLTYGLLFALNSWDFVVYTVFLALLMFVRGMDGIRAEPYRPWEAFSRRLRDAIVDLLLIGATAFLSAAPFIANSAPGASAGWGFVQDFEFNSLSQVFGAFGPWIFAVAAILIVCGIDWRRVSPGVLAVASAAAAGPFLLAAASIMSGFPKQPWGILTTAAALLFLALVFGLQRGAGRREQMIAICVALAAATLFGSEELFISDRMNTIFKFYNPIWVLLVLSTAALLPRLLDQPVSGIHARRLRRAVQFVCAIFFFLSMAGSVVNIVIMTTFQRAPGARPTLDGMAYLDASPQLREEKHLIDWLRERVNGTPTVLEAQGPSYGAFTRIAMNTGLPTVLGWEHHVRQRGLSDSELRRRQTDIRQIYSTNESAVAFELLHRYSVEYIVVGLLERETYPAEGLRKFEQHSDLFEPVFAEGNTRLYRVRSVRTAPSRNAKSS